MRLKTLFYKNKIFSIGTLFFSIWIIILVLLAIFSSREVVFWNALGQSDVSSDYLSFLPFLRYIFEPFASIAFILEYRFTWLFLYLIVYPILRVIYVFLRKSGKLNSSKYNHLKHLLTDFIYFSFKVFSITLVAILLIVLLGYLIQGFFFVNRYFMVPVQIGIHFSVILISIKAGFSLLKLFHPRLKFNFARETEKEN